VSEQRGNQQQQRRRNRSKAKPRTTDLWRPVPAGTDPEPIVPGPDPATLVRSLGRPPLQHQSTAAEYYFATVVERAAALAAALAASADLLGAREEDTFDDAG
jgi:hypothetical protein